jgi:hypothetical protein
VKRDDKSHTVIVSGSYSVNKVMNIKRKKTSDFGPNFSKSTTYFHTQEKRKCCNYIEEWNHCKSKKQLRIVNIETFSMDREREPLPMRWANKFAKFANPRTLSMVSNCLNLSQYANLKVVWELNIQFFKFKNWFVDKSDKW